MLGGDSDGTSGWRQTRVVPEASAQSALDAQPGGRRAPRERGMGDHVRVAEELADHQAARRLQDPPQLPQGRFLVGDLPSTVTR